MELPVELAVDDPHPPRDDRRALAEPEDSAGTASTVTNDDPMGTAQGGVGALFVAGGVATPRTRSDELSVADVTPILDRLLLAHALRVPG